MDAGPIRPGDELDWASLEKYLRDHLDLDLSDDMSVRQFPHGSANLTYLVEFGDTAVVVRRPPFGEIAPGAHDMRREDRVLSGLGDRWDKAPRCLAFCDDHSVIGSDFVVMEFVRGVVIRSDGIPAGLADHADVGRRVSMALIDATAELHLLDPDACGLGDLGRPGGFVARQVGGWWKRWQLVAPDDAGYDKLMARLHERLEAALPDPPKVSFVHSDLKLNNCLFDPADPDRVRAVLDWDMTTLGDPLVDVGTLLNYWPDDGDAGRGSAALLPELQDMGLPNRRELVARYEERSGLPVGDIDFYVAFAAWKTAVVAQQLFRRYEMGDSADDSLAAVGGQGRIWAEVAEVVLG